MLALAGVAATLGAEQLPALATVAPGQWQLKEIGGDGVRSLCLADPAVVLQLAHGDAQCTRDVLDSGADAVTVHYSCPGVGNGRSTLTVRSPSSFKLETQGLVKGAPFAVDYDAKRTGDCAGAAPPR